MTVFIPSTMEGNYHPHPKHGEGTVFTGVCLSTQEGGGGYPSPSHNTSTGPMSFLGGTQSPFHNLIGSMPFWSTPQSQVGVPLSQAGCTPVPGRGLP